MKRRKWKMNTIIIIICIFMIILLLAIIGWNIAYSNQNENFNETNTENNINTSHTDNILVKDSQNSESSDSIEENNSENSIANSEETIEEGSETMDNQKEEIKINLIINNKTFTATLNNNETVKELISMFPMTLHMSDLHANEKYNYLNSNLTTNSNAPGRIHAGDIKLFGNNCLVVFYDSFATSYSYTDLGKVDDVDGFVSELGSGNVTITFEIAE